MNSKTMLTTYADADFNTIIRVLVDYLKILVDQRDAYNIKQLVTQIREVSGIYVAFVKKAKKNWGKECFLNYLPLEFRDILNYANYHEGRKKDNFSVGATLYKDRIMAMDVHNALRYLKHWDGSGIWSIYEQKNKSAEKEIA